MPKIIAFSRLATVVLLSVLFSLLLGGCAAGESTPTPVAQNLNQTATAPVPTATPDLTATAAAFSPTGTPAPTATPLPTATPAPTATPTVILTATPIPVPTSTPLVKLDGPKVPFLDRFTFRKTDDVTLLKPGVIHMQRVETGPIRLNVLLFDLTAPEFQLRVVLQDDYLSGVSKTSTLARDNNALAAVNGDLFSGTGLPQGMTMTDGKLAMAPKRRATFAWGKDGPFIGYFTQGFTWPSSVQAANGEYHSLEVLNTTCEDNWLCIYNDLTHQLAPTYNDTKVVLDATGTVTAISQQASLKIAGGTQVLVGRGTAGKWLQANVNVGDTLNLNMVTDPDYHKFDQIVSGGPVFLRNGRFIQDCMCYLEDCGQSQQKNVLCEEFTTDWKETHYLTIRMPRNAIGYNDDKSVLMVAVVDGYQPGYSIGMTQKELAGLFTDYGMTTAMELDGGGSATMWLEGKLASHPSDGNGYTSVERMVPDAVVFNWNDGEIPADDGTGDGTGNISGSGETTPYPYNTATPKSTSSGTVTRTTGPTPKITPKVTPPITSTKTTGATPKTSPTPGKTSGTR
jgi:hypothetical protein